MDSTLSTVLQVVITATLGLIAWFLRRLVATNDQAHSAIRSDLRIQVSEIRRDEDRRHEDLDVRIKELLSAVAAEREARHQLNQALQERVKQVDDRVWQVREDSHPRREALRMFGSLAQKVDLMQTTILDRIEKLPCKSGSTCEPEQT